MCVYSARGHRLKLDVTDPHLTCGAVRNFSCTLQNEEDFVGRTTPKSQGCIPCLRGGILWCWHTPSSLALVALRTLRNIDVLCQWLCLAALGYLLWYKTWIRITWRLNHTTCATNSSKQSHFVQRIWSFSLRLVETPNSVHFQRDCAFVWICCIRREMNAWQCFVRT